MLSNKAIRSVFLKYKYTLPSSLPSHGQRALPFTYLLLLPSSAGLLGRGRRIEGFSTLFLLISFLFCSVNGKGGGVDDALRGRGGGGWGEGREIKPIKAALIY